MADNGWLSRGHCVLHKVTQWDGSSSGLSTLCKGRTSKLRGTSERTGDVLKPMLCQPGDSVLRGMPRKNSKVLGVNSQSQKS